MERSMSRQLHISTESDYLRAHLTVIASEPHGELGVFHNLRGRATALLKAFFANRVVSVGRPPTCSPKQLSVWRFTGTCATFCCCFIVLSSLIKLAPEVPVASGQQFIYYYHDGPNADEVNDPFSGMPIPKKGEVIERRGKKYEVRSVQAIVGKAVPTYIVRLMNTM